MALLYTTLQLLGLLWAASIFREVARIIWVYCIRSSSLPKYRHANEGSWALVTGASDGIGIEMARQLLRHGFNVFIHGRNATKLQGIKEDLLKISPDRSVEIIVADATKSDLDFDAIVRKVQGVPGKLTVLMNNVGGIPMQRKIVTVDETSRQDVDETIAMNVTFPTQLTVALMPLLKRNQPSLIFNHGSGGGVIGLPYIAIYTATKAYVHTFTMGLRTELESEGEHGVETFCSVTGNTKSRSNTQTFPLISISSEACAKGILARVGSGEVLVTPNLQHKLADYLFTLVPEILFRKVLGAGMRDWRAREQREVDALKKAG